MEVMLYGPTSFLSLIFNSAFLTRIVPAPSGAGGLSVGSLWLGLVDRVVMGEWQEKDLGVVVNTVIRRDVVRMGL